MRRVELLAPAGNMEKCEIALAYGADAVYFGAGDYNLRSRSGNFSMDDIGDMMSMLHDKGKKGYMTLNIYQRNSDIKGMSEAASEAARRGVDAFIVSNPGALSLVKRAAPGIDIHVSTQANITDIESAAAWRDMGASRVILSRELSLTEISDITAHSGIETEVFVHGSMCMAYSGRCLMSKYMTGRDANAGDCAHPCRWEYYVREKSRKDELFEIREDERGLYIFNSRDLMLFDRIPEIISAGPSSLKIEGRIKGLLYLATVVRAYRHALDSYYNGLAPSAEVRDSLFQANNRGYHEGFIDGPDGYMSNLETSRTFADYDLLGYIDGSGGFNAKAPAVTERDYEYIPASGDGIQMRFLELDGFSEQGRAKIIPGRTYAAKTEPELPPYTVIRYKKDKITK